MCKSVHEHVSVCGTGGWGGRGDGGVRDRERVCVRERDRPIDREGVCE